MGEGIKIKTWGPNIFEFTWLNNLRFADDIVIIAKRGAELKEIVECLAKASAKVGLSINILKTIFSTNIKDLEEMKSGWGGDHNKSRGV